MTRVTARTGSVDSRQARAIVVHRERDLDMVVRKAQDALFPLVLVALAWLLATSASVVR